MTAPFPLTDTITIRLVAPGDHVALFSVIDRNRYRLRAYFPVTAAAMENMDAAERFVEQRIQLLQHKEGFFFVLTSGEEIIGVVIIKEIDWRVPKCELAYFIDEAYEGRGIITAAVKWIVDYCFNELNMEKICIVTNPANEGSRRVALHNGFVKEGHMRHEYRNGLGVLTDMEYYGLSKS